MAKNFKTLSKREKKELVPMELCQKLSADAVFQFITSTKDEVAIYDEWLHLTKSSTASFRKDGLNMDLIFGYSYDENGDTKGDLYLGYWNDGVINEK